MPTYLHQWRYRPEVVKAMLSEKTEREKEVRTVTEAFGGTLKSFFFCMGHYDGVAIIDYPDDETALASLMAQYTLGKVDTIDTTTLVAPEGIRTAKKLACEVLGITPEE
jgi:uncharacterized protein with GYD domain